MDDSRAVGGAPATTDDVASAVGPQVVIAPGLEPPELLGGASVRPLLDFCSISKAPTVHIQEHAAPDVFDFEPTVARVHQVKLLAGIAVVIPIPELGAIRGGIVGNACSLAGDIGDDFEVILVFRRNDGPALMCRGGIRSPLIDCSSVGRIAADQIHRQTAVLVHDHVITLYGRATRRHILQG